MKSKAAIKSHPLHAILVPFPIAFFTGAFVLDLLYFFSGASDLQKAGYILLCGGLISAILAAVPGIIDYIYAVPPESSAKKRAGRHGMINGSAVLVFLFALLFKKDASVSPFLILALECAGVVLVSAGSWLGGTLVIRNQIGVDHRYAHAGKWKELRIATKERKVKLPQVEALKTDQMLLLRLNDLRIVIGKTESGLVAFEDRCSHRGASLADGVLICGTIQCPWHGSQFDTASGYVKAGPARESIKIYTIREEAGSFVLEW